MKIKILSTCLLLAAIHNYSNIEVNTKESIINAQEKNILIKINLESPDEILAQTISVSLDNPHTTLGSISINPDPTQQYLPEFSESKDILKDEILLTVPVKINTDQEVQANIHLSFLLLPYSMMIEKIIPIAFNQSDQNIKNQTENPIKVTPYPLKKINKSFSESLQGLIEKTNNNWIRLLFAFLLGLLLSLTPCIYPMIPITIGILHNQNKKSLFYNFLGSCCYAFGISTMFAGLGLLAAFAGASFGSLLSTPLFVLILVAFMGYMSLTMIGIMDLKIPSFLQKSSNLNTKFGPYVSVYLFGLISGSVASPCVSPGLALLLTMVATMGNIFAGFALLFCFGIGLSTPLIIIGTFSSSMSLLPKAGQWMVEVKKALGFAMLATCLYYLNNVLPAMAMSLITIAYLLFAALFYIIDAQKDFNSNTKTIKSFLGIILLAATVFMSFKTYDQKNKPLESKTQKGVIWNNNYQDALITAKIDKKLLMLDFWANHCTICKAIEKKIFHKDMVYQALKDRFIFVTVDCTSSHNQQATELKHKFKIYAQPAILIVDPNSETILKKWSSEPYSMTPEEFVKTAKTF